MSFALSAEQIELRDSLRRFLSETITTDYLRQRFESPQATDPTLWNKLSEFGLLEMFSERDASSVRDLVMVAQEAGRVLLPENIVDTIIVMRACAAGTTQAIASGRKRVALGVQTAGSIDFCAGASVATDLVAIAKDKSWYFSQVSPAYCTTIDALDRTILYANVDTSSLKATKLNSSIRSELMIARSAELVGIGEVVLARTLEYAKTRKQFGVAIASFQAIAHRLSEMLLRVESCRSLVEFAAWTLDASPQQSALASLAACAHAFSEMPRLVEESIQIHGGIGFTWEFDLHLYLRRAKFIEAVWGPDEAELLSILEIAENS